MNEKRIKEIIKKMFFQWDTDLAKRKELFWLYYRDDIRNMVVEMMAEDINAEIKRIITNTINTARIKKITIKIIEEKLEKLLNDRIDENDTDK